jgi:hypothetical protein
LWLILGLSLVTLIDLGCAGPATPFGAMNWPSFLGGTNSSSLAPGYRLKFSPERQVLHSSTDLELMIEDADGVPENPKLQLSYNGKDVTSSFIGKAEKTYTDPSKRRLKMTFKNFRLQLLRDHDIHATYWPSKRQEPVSVIYAPPSCSAFSWNGSLTEVPGFDVDPNLISSIDKLSSGQRYNPFLVAGLIAQESAFNPKAVSRSKALGLTQVTPLGEAEIIGSYEEWPRYPGISDMGFWSLRSALNNGKIHPKNEWRLDPDLSIRGGVEYLKYLNEYWSRPDKAAFIDKYFHGSEFKRSEILLASYNSGAARVSQALDANGENFLKNKELGEARKYVRKITSYCDYFSQKASKEAFPKAGSVE